MKQRKPIYSFGIIFKNDIRCLGRCLRSLQPVRDAVPCELVMADTGSSDGSREIAERYADIVFDFPWCDDFSAARNAVVERCSGEWYFSLDTDEWLDGNVKELIQFAKAKVKWDFAAYTIRNYQSQDLGKTGNYLDFSAIRVMRLSTGTRYHGCIHESWTPLDGSGLSAMMLGETLVHHDGYVYRDEAAVLAKKERNQKLLDKKLAENPNDFQSLVECIDGTKSFDDVSVEYARRAVEGVRQRWTNWEKSGPTVFRNAVSAAKLRKKPELMEWAEESVRTFPESIYITVDVAYYALCQCWDEKDYTACARWGEMYRKGIADYESENFDQSETLRGALEFASPYWQRRLLILLAQTYLELQEYETALLTCEKIKFRELDEAAQVKHCTNILLRLHRMTALDVQPQMVRLWEEVGNSAFGAEMVEKGREMLTATVARTFTPDYRSEEETREGFSRHGFTLFTCLEGKCPLGLGAAILTSEDPAVIAEKLGAVESWEDIPIHILAHALKCGALFPSPIRPLKLEEMDTLAHRLTEAGYDMVSLACAHSAESNCQGLYWTRALTLAAIRGCKWENGEQGMLLTRRFAQIEQRVLAQLYMPDMLRGENILVLPPMDRFGFYCGQAFRALDIGDTVDYVRLLREGLSVCENMKPMVEFLLEHTSELREEIAPSEELKALAEQVRALLVRFSPDDPAVEALKQSEAYQRVAFLLEQS